MASFSLPQHLSLRGLRPTQQKQPAQGGSYPLQQMSARPQQSAGGLLQQDGAESLPPPPLEQHQAEPQQSEGCFGGLRASFSRLRKKMHYDGKKLQKRPDAQARTDSQRLQTRLNGLPERPGAPQSTAQYTRNSTRQPGERGRPGPDDSDAHSPVAQNYTRASRHNRLPGEATRDETPAIPDRNPLRDRPAIPQRNPLRNQQPLAQPPQDSDAYSLSIYSTDEPQNTGLETIIEEEDLTPEQLQRKDAEAAAEIAQQIATQFPGPSAKAQGKQPASAGLATIPEEKFAELQESNLTPMQQIAREAAENDTAERKNILRPQVATMELDAKGKLEVTSSVSDNLRNILNETVARPRHTYQAHQGNDDGSQHLLMDPNGRLLSLQGSKTAFVGLTQSIPVKGWKQQEPSTMDNLLDKTGLKNQTTRSDAQIRFTDDGNATISSARRGSAPDNTDRNRTVALPSNAIHSRLTGIHQHLRDVGGTPEMPERISESLREHNGRLYRLDEAGMHWDQVDKDEEKTFGKLTKQADGKLYAVHDKKTLHNLSTGKKSEDFKGKVGNYSVGSNGEMVVLLSDKKTTKQSVQFLGSLEAKKDDQKTIALKSRAADAADDAEPADFHATNVTLHNGQLFAISSKGKLFSADAPTADSKEVVLTEDTTRSAQLRQHLGEKFSIEEFLNQGDGKLVALVKDTSNQRHACVLGANGEFRPEWNLSESLIMDHHEGLLRPRPLPQDVVDMGRLGQVILHDGKINTFNKNSQRWEASFENADSLKRGQDGQAYAIKDGMASRVKVSLKSDSIGGVNNQFIMRQMKSNVSLDIPLVGLNENNKAKAIAPLDAERYVALSEKGELQFHRNLAGSRQPDKLMRPLTKDGIANHLPHTMAVSDAISPPQGHGNELIDVAMDHKQTLYVLDKQGQLFSMPKDHWQEPQTTHPTPGWQPVTLPDEMGEIASLHNAPDGALMVADTDGRSAILQLAGTKTKARVREENPDRAASPSGSADRSDSAQAQPQRNLSPPAPHVRNRSPADLARVSSPGSQQAQPVNQQNLQQVVQQDRWLVQPEYDPNKKLEAKTHRRRVEKAWERLDETTKSKRVLGMTLKREVNLLGMTGRDGNHINSRLRDRLRAHVFNPTLATPRPIKNAGYSIQHNWQGREGLRPLYEHQANLHSELKTLANQPAPAFPRNNLMSRLDHLDKSKFGADFVDHLRNFVDGVADSSLHHSALLGQHVKALKDDRTPVEDFTPSRFRAATQAMNPNSGTENLVQELSQFYDRYPMRAENDSSQLIRNLDQQGVNLRHQKANPPLGRQRDPYDDLSLSKSRLILDGIAMSKLHDMLDEMEQIAGDDASDYSDVQDLQERFRTLRDDTYGEDPVRKATGQGFVSHKQLEASYDAIKSMTKAFSKQHHGVNMTTRTVLKAKDQAQMTERLHRTITSLEPGENMGFGRNYGGLLTLSVIPGSEVVGVPGVRGNLDRAYNLSFSRGDTGINVSFTRNGGGTGTAFGAVGWNPVSLVDNYDAIQINLGEHRKMTPSARLGGMVSMALQRQLQNNVSFTLSEAELKPFLEKLTSGQINPQELMDKGTGHRVKNGTTLTFNVDAALTAFAGGGISLPTNPADPKNNAATIRGNVLAQVGANVATAQRDRNTTRSDGGVNQGRSNNRMRFMNNASASVGLVGGVGISTTANDKLRIPMFGVSNTNVQVSIDNRTKQSMSLDLGRADAVEPQQLDKLMEQIGLNFDDAELNKLAQELKDAANTPDKPENKLPESVKIAREERLRQLAADPLSARQMSKKDRDDLEKLQKNDKTLGNSSLPKDTVIADPQPSGRGPALHDAPLRNEEGEIVEGPQNKPESSETQAKNLKADDSKKEDEDKEKFSTFLKEPKEALKLKLDKVIDHLLAMEPANNGQYGVINTAKQLRLQQNAAALHSQALNSAEYSSTYNNLHKISSNNLMHVIHSLFASELPPSNAERISSFMEEKPMLKEVIRELQKHSDTQAVVTLELKDQHKYKTQQLWLDHKTQPEDIRKMLVDNNNLRVKSISFTETNEKKEGVNLPIFVTGGSSSANVSMSRNLGKINFSYGEDQEKPHSFSLEGEIAYATENVVSALTNAEVQDKRGVL